VVHDSVRWRSSVVFVHFATRTGISPGEGGAMILSKRMTRARDRLALISEAAVTSGSVDAGVVIAIIHQLA